MNIRSGEKIVFNENSLANKTVIDGSRTREVRIEQDYLDSRYKVKTEVKCNPKHSSIEEPLSGIGTFPSFGEGHDKRKRKSLLEDNPSSQRMNSYSSTYNHGLYKWRIPFYEEQINNPLKFPDPLGTRSNSNSLDLFNSYQNRNRL